MRNKVNVSCVLFLLLSILLFMKSAESKSIRTVTVGEGEVVNVKTSLGYSTLLEFSSKPTSAVLGDQDAFKLEYVGNSLTLKPLLPRAHSNLFIFTEFDRFNCEIRTVSMDQVDYIVRIRAKEKSYPLEEVEHAEHFVKTSIQKEATYDGFALKVISQAKEQDLSHPRSVTLIDFELSSTKRAYSFQAGSVGVKQLGKYLRAESIYLDRVDLTPSGGPIHGRIALLSQDFNSRLPVRLLFAVPDVRIPRKAHLIEVSTLRQKRSEQSNKKGQEPWEQGPPNADPKLGPVSTSISSPMPIPIPSVEALGLGALPFSPAPF